MTDCLVIVPMLGRPHTVAPLLESLAGTDGVRVLFVCTPDDDDVIVAVRKADADLLVHASIPGRGDYASKTNVAYRTTKDPLLFLGACDLKFHPGWLDAATAKLTDGIGVVGTNDLGNRRVMRGEHSTHSLVTREYADRGLIDATVGKVLCDQYVHEYVDDELVGTAKKRNAWAFAADSIVEHMHPQFGKAPMDAMYARQLERMTLSRQIFMERRRMWTGAA